MKPTHELLDSIDRRCFLLPQFPGRKNIQIEKEKRMRNYRAEFVKHSFQLVHACALSSKLKRMKNKKKEEKHKMVP